MVRGSLAPDGAVIKISAATAALLRHRGPALVFHGYEDMRRRVEDPALDVTPDSVLVLAGCGPVGVPGMPEWGMIPIPAKLVTDGVTDMVRVTDARMSGTSFGTVFLHVAPEAATGGPLALVRDGDPVAVDVAAGTLDAGRARRRTGPAPAALDPAGLRPPARLARAATATTCCRHPRAATWTSCGPRRRSTAGSSSRSSGGPERTGQLTAGHAVTPRDIEHTIFTHRKETAVRHWTVLAAMAAAALLAAACSSGGGAAARRRARSR